jgi:hypothetical protein
MPQKEELPLNNASSSLITTAAANSRKKKDGQPDIQKSRDKRRK